MNTKTTGLITIAVALALAVVATTIAVQTVNAAPPAPELT
jgi:hypothetical protein